MSSCKRSSALVLWHAPRAKGGRRRHAAVQTPAGSGSLAQSQCHRWSLKGQAQLCGPRLPSSGSLWHVHLQRDENRGSTPGRHLQPVRGSFHSPEEIVAVGGGSQAKHLLPLWVPLIALLFFSHTVRNTLAEFLKQTGRSMPSSI